MKRKYDLIVAGAGTAGCILAKKAAEAGYRVALLDVKKRADIGFSWDIAVEKHVFGRICLKIPDKRLLTESPEQYRFYAEHPDYHIRMDAFGDSVFYINHRELNRYLLDIALAAGVSFFEGHDVKEILTDNTTVCGVCGIRKGIFRSSYFSLKAPVTSDATGFHRVLSKQVPPAFMIQGSVEKKDMVFAWQEEREMPQKYVEEFVESTGIKPGIFYTCLGHYNAYRMMFLRKNNTLLLIFATPQEEQKVSARRRCEEFLKDYPYIGKRIASGGKMIGIRHSIDSMVGDGFLCVGDAACQNVPITGSGVSSSLYAADIAASTITKALNRGDVSTSSLWSYNHHYQTKRGAIMANYDIIRLFLQHLGVEKLKKIFRSGLFYNENFMQLYSSSQINYDMHHIADVFLKMFTNPGLFSIGVDIAQTIVDANRIFQYYQKYPLTDNKITFFQWRYNVNRYFKKYHYYKEFAVDYVAE
ncbi:MAG: NAD(P)/FAD-dependent oxidoreductase [Spirochaetales bacterium]|nr:NAD(P)/FAD-dependent oxidoreductase [Spirochaetales bacterium]